MKSFESRARGLVALVAVTAVLVLLPTFGADDGTLRTVILIATMTLIVSGFNLAYGFAGELAIGQVAMYAIGAYVGGRVLHQGHDMVWAMALATLAAAIAGFATSILGLRLAGWGLAMTTFFLILLIPDVVQLLEEWTGGLIGMTGIPSGVLFGQPLDYEGLYALTVVACAIWLLFVRNVVLSSVGVRLLTLRESPVLARSMGINVYGTKVLTYTLAAMPAGLAGCLLAARDQFVTPGYFTMAFTISVIAASILGGPQTVYGAVLGAAVLQFLSNNSEAFAEYAYPAYGAVLVLCGLFLRNGVVGLMTAGARRLSGSGPGRRDGDPDPTVDVPDAEELEPSDDTAWPEPLTGLAAAELRLSGVTKEFGGVRAVDDLTMVAPPGKVTALIGANGSGKTTTINLVSGFYRVTEGSIRVGDQEVSGRAAHAVARVGVARTFQTPLVPAGMSVREIVAAAALGPRYRPSVLSSALRLPGYRRDRRRALDRADAFLARTGLNHLRDLEGASLPLGQRRLVEVVRALAASPAVLLLDEPASGLDYSEVHALARIIADAARALDMTVLLVEHNFELVSSLADYIYVLETGRLIAEGPSDVIREDPVVIRSYLGELDAVEPEPDQAGSHS